MRYDKRGGGFVRLGTIRLEDAGVGGSRARSILLAHAWRRVAGEALARRVEARRIVRGVLEIDAVDPAWGEASRRLLPVVLGRMVRAWPQLGIRRARIVVAGIERDVIEPGAEPEEPSVAQDGPSSGPDC